MALPTIVLDHITSPRQPLRLTETTKRPCLLPIIIWSLIQWVSLKRLAWRVFNAKPRRSFLLFDGLCPTVRRIKEFAGGYVALETLYTWQPRQKPGFLGRLEDFWLKNTTNVWAVRNRLALVKAELEMAIKQQASEHTEVRVLEVAAGSARALIEVMAKLRAEGIIVVALLLDKDPEALDYAKNLAEEWGVAEQIKLTRSTVAFLQKVAKEFQPHIIEMVGFHDYLNEDKANRLNEWIYRALPPEGIYINANVMPNPEQAFIHRVYGWPAMQYRTPEELAEVMAGEGFESCRLVIEPLEVHCLAIGRKTG